MRSCAQKSSPAQLSANVSSPLRPLSGKAGTYPFCPLILFPRDYNTCRASSFLRAPPARLSNASFVSCAAAVGGGKARDSQSHAPSQSSKGKAKQPARPGSERSKGSGSSREKGAPRVPVGGGAEVAEPPEEDPATCEEASTIGVDAVAVELSRRARVPARRASAPLYFAFDHCFSVRGQGTILTGTVLTGEVKVRAGKSAPFSRRYPLRGV